MSKLAETYRRASADELVELHADCGSLTDEAREAIEAEIGRRGLSDEQIALTNDAQNREHEEQRQVQLDAKRKNSVPWPLLFGQIVSILVVAVVAMLFLGLINTSPKQDEATGEVFVYAMIFTLSVCLLFFRGKIWLTVAVAISIDAAILVFLRFFAVHS